VFQLIGVVHGPADPLDELAGEVLRLEIARRDALLPDDCVRGLLRVLGDDEYLGHRSLLRCRGSRSSFPYPHFRLVNIE
jgi:hypothetical protein